MLFYLNRKMNDAVIDVDGDNIYLKKGSMIKTSFMPTFELHRKGYYDKWVYVVNNLIDDNDLLVSDYKVSSLSEASVIVLAGQIPNNDIWKDKDGLCYSDVFNGDVTLENDEDKHQYLVSFLEDIDILNDLDSEIEFNVFETLSIIKNEIRHSNVLSWLLNPNETHGLNDFFLKSFIRQVYKNNNVYLNLKPEEIYLWDFDDVEVFKEKNNIDILVVDNINEFVLVIENKIDTGEHSNQLNRYRETIYRMYPNYRYMFVYMTKFGDEPSDNDNWGSYSYTNLLDDLLTDTILKANDKAKSFLKDYSTILRRYIVRDENIEEICHQIYSKHKKALDLIYEYKPDIINEISKYIIEYIKKENDLTLNHCTKSIVRFENSILSTINLQFKEFAGSWVKDKSVLLFEIKVSESSVILVTTLGPTKDESREEILSHCLNKKVNFVKTKSKKWTTIKSTQIAKISEDDSLDIITKKINDGLKSKLSKHISDISNIFNDYIK